MQITQEMGWDKSGRIEPDHAGECRNGHAVAAILHDLIEAGSDGETGFRVCAEEAMGLQLKSAFTLRSQCCAAAVRELAGLLRLPDSDTGAAAGATFHRRWTDIRSIILNKDNGAILVQCERGEAMTLNSYRNALAAHLPPAVREVLERQYLDVLRQHGQTRLLLAQMRLDG